MDGERRYRAYRKLAASNPKFSKIPASFISKDDAINGVLANIARQIYNLIELAEALQIIKDTTNHTDTEIGKLVGRFRSSITGYLDLLKLSVEIRELAKRESIVSFRRLKKLVASEKSDEDKIIEYNKMHEQFHKHSEEIDVKHRKEKEWKPARKVMAFQNTINKFTTSLCELSLQGLDDTNVKGKLKASLQEMRNRAQKLLVGLE